MVGLLLSLALLIGLLLAVAGALWALTSAGGPVDAWLRRGSIARTVRRETADLDRGYEQLLQG